MPRARSFSRLLLELFWTNDVEKAALDRCIVVRSCLLDSSWCTVIMPAREIYNSRTHYMPASEVLIAPLSHHLSTAWIPEVRYDCDIDQAQSRNGV